MTSPWKRTEEELAAEETNANSLPLNYNELTDVQQRILQQTGSLSYTAHKPTMYLEIVEDSYLQIRTNDQLIMEIDIDDARKLAKSILQVIDTHK